MKLKATFKTERSGCTGKDLKYADLYSFRIWYTPTKVLAWTETNKRSQETGWI